MASDLHLLRRYHEHADAFAFRELVQAHAGMVFATARRVTRDAARAEDVAQETFLELARQAATVNESVGAWLHRVAWRRACNVVRSEGTRRRYEEAAVVSATSGRGETPWEELEPLIDEALEALPERWREPLVDHFLEGRTQQEIAARLGVSQSTVSRLLDSGIDELRVLLRRKGLTTGASLAVLLAAQATVEPPAALMASLGKVAVSGVGGGVVAKPVGLAALGRWWRIAVVGVGAAAVGMGIFVMLPQGSEAGGPAPAPATEVEGWRGRAFCPMCAQPVTPGRQPEHGIFMHPENGTEVIYDLKLSEPVADFHRRYCVPSMDNGEAVQASGTVAMRDGRRTLIVRSLRLATQ